MTTRIITKVDTLCKEGLVDEAEDVIHIMKQQNVNLAVITFSALIDGYCLQGHMDEAENLFYSFMARMDNAPHIWSYDILINGHCEKIKIDEALDIFREISCKGLKHEVGTYNIILQGLFCSATCSTALEIIDKMQAIGLMLKLYTYSNVGWIA